MEFVYDTSLIYNDCWERGGGYLWRQTSRIEVEESFGLQRMVLGFSENLSTEKSIAVLDGFVSKTLNVD